MKFIYIPQLVSSGELHLRAHTSEYESSAASNVNCREGEVLTMNELMLRARQRMETVIGYRLSGQRHPTLNPKGRDERNLSRKTIEHVIVIAASA